MSIIIPDRLDAEVCLKCGGVLLDTRFPMCSSCQKKTLKQFARMKERKAKKKKKKK